MSHPDLRFNPAIALHGYWSVSPIVPPPFTRGAEVGPAAIGAPLPTAAQLRAELRRAIRCRGITAVAAETGAAHQTLRAYLAGARVTSATRAKLLSWYTRYAEGE